MRIAAGIAAVGLLILCIGAIGGMADGIQVWTRATTVIGLVMVGAGIGVGVVKRR